MTSSKSNNKLVEILLIAAAASTTVYLLMLGWYNTLSLDDYGFAVDMRSNTPFSWAKQMYLSWQGRFSAFFVSGIIFKLFANPTYLKIWTLLHLLLGYSVVWLFVRNVARVKEIRISIALSVLLTNIAICSSFEISTFYWLCCAGYFLAVYSTLLLIYVVFFSRSNQWIRYAVAVFCSLYISGSAENYTPVVLLALGFIWLYNIVKDAKQMFLIRAFRKHQLLFIVCAILGIGFLAMLFAPGNKVRANQGGQLVGFMHNFVLCPFIKKTIIANLVFGLRLLSRGLYVLGIFPIAVWIGMRMKKKETVDSHYVRKRILFSTFSLFVLIFAAVTGCVYGIGYYPPLRSMGFVLFMVNAWILYNGILIGRHYADKLNFDLSVCLMVCLCLWIGYGVYFTAKEQPVLKQYHTYIVERDTKIRELSEIGEKEPLTVQSLVLPDWTNSYTHLRNFINRCMGSNKVIHEHYFPYMASELSDDPNDFRNKGLQQYYYAEFDIIGYPIEYVLRNRIQSR